MKFFLRMLLDLNEDVFLCFCTSQIAQTSGVLIRTDSGLYEMGAGGGERLPLIAGAFKAEAEIVITPRLFQNPELYQKKWIAQRCFVSVSALPMFSRVFLLEQQTRHATLHLSTWSVVI